MTGNRKLTLLAMTIVGVIAIEEGEGVVTSIDVSKVSMSKAEQVKAMGEESLGKRGKTENHGAMKATYHISSSTRKMWR